LGGAYKKGHGIIVEIVYKKKQQQRSWRKTSMMIPCKTCGKSCETKNKHYAICESCMKNYLNSLEEMAKQNKKQNKCKEVRNQQYHKLYRKITAVKERLSDIPRQLEVEKAYDRECLRCDKSFVASGKYNRICHNCKSIIENYEDYYI
tara:strand:- start:3220 stop:3663 length:444 start_codon:yes stop_codon:yes gene_type:complete